MIDTLTAWYRGKRQELPVSVVTHFTAGDKYVTAHHPGGELIISISLARLEKSLPEFIRVHRGMLVRRSCLLGAGRHGHEGERLADVTFQTAPVVIGRTRIAEVDAYCQQRGVA